jgi:hypothetical protein
MNALSLFPINGFSDNWKKMRLHQPVKGNSLRAFYHNLGHVCEEKIIWHRFRRCMCEIRT